MRENYKEIEQSLKKGYSIVFLVKKDVNTKEISFKQINMDMLKIFKKAKLIVMD